MRSRTTLLLLGLALAGSPVPRIHAQQESGIVGEAPMPEEQPATAGGLDFTFTFGGGYTHRFNTDIDSGGEIANDTVSFGLTIDHNFNPDVSLAFQMNYVVASYDFGGSSGFGGLDPWNDIHTFNFGAVLSVDVNDSLSVFGGPVFQFSRESGADWNDGFTGGGIGGLTYRIHDRLVIGGGVGVVSQIEDDVRVFPIIIIEWQFADHWRVSSRGGAAIGRASIEFTGVELVWNPRDHWEFAMGGASAFSRFRLDDGGFNGDGVGQDESMPVWLRATWRPNATIGIDAVGGFGFGGEVLLDDSDGHGVARSDYDIAPFIGLFASVRF